MNTVVAIVLFLSPGGPADTWVARQTFPTLAACQHFVTTTTDAMDARRAQLEAITGRPVHYSVICHDAGRGA